MANKTIKTTFLLKRASTETWESLNPILKYGEPGYEKDNGKLKIGDGITPWNNLSYLTDVNTKIIVDNPQEGEVLTYNAAANRWENKRLEFSNIMSGTTEYWNDKPQLIPKKDTIIIYTDYQSKEEEGNIINIPGIKIADGSAFLIDQPFVDEDIRKVVSSHINNSDIHITPQEREFWNNKVRCYLDTLEQDNIIFTIH